MLMCKNCLADTTCRNNYDKFLVYAFVNQYKHLAALVDFEIQTSSYLMCNSLNENTVKE